MNKYFYTKNNFKSLDTNLSYHDIVSMSDDLFREWAIRLRDEIRHRWDVDGTPPLSGKSEKQIIERMSTLKPDDCDFFIKDEEDSESLGIIKNFNRNQSVVNQFFPTMLKTKISDGASSETAYSIYDYFSEDHLKESFIKTMIRAVRKDSMYAWCKSLSSDIDENPFWNGQTPTNFIKDVYEGSIFNGKWSDCDMILSQTTTENIKKYGTLNQEESRYGSIFFLTASEVKILIDDGYLQDRHVINLGDIDDSYTLKSGKVVNYLYNIRWYFKSEKIFPKVLQAFRLGLSQPAVNFPALTAKWIYENYTSHIDSNQVANIYDSSSGWGGRIIGAMSARRKVHYIGTDPNPDNYINEIGMSRYEYMAKFYNDNCVNNYSSTFTKFFEADDNSNTYELFQDGSELIHNNPQFKKYEGKLDLAFTSPPYFNREQYSQDENQSFKAYSQYDDWRDKFLKPTLTTIYDYMKSDRYILWNIASIRISKNTYFDLEQDSIDILKSLGCEYKGKYKMLMSAMIGANINKRDGVIDGVKNYVKVGNKYFKYEPIFVFYKK